MKNLSVITLGVALIGAVALQAEDTEVKAPKKAPRSISRTQMLEKYDTNKNGVLDPEEKAVIRKEGEARREAAQKESLKKYDKNGDGKLDQEERAAMREDIRSKRPKQLEAAHKPTAAAPAPEKSAP